MGPTQTINQILRCSLQFLSEVSFA